MFHHGSNLARPRRLPRSRPGPQWLALVATLAVLWVLPAASGQQKSFGSWEFQTQAVVNVAAGQTNVTVPLSLPPDPPGPDDNEYVVERISLRGAAPAGQTWRFALGTLDGFTGSTVWHYLPLPQTSPLSASTSTLNLNVPLEGAYLFSGNFGVTRSSGTGSGQVVVTVSGRYSGAFGPEHRGHYQQTVVLQFANGQGQVGAIVAPPADALSSGSGQLKRISVHAEMPNGDVRQYYITSTYKGVTASHFLPVGPTAPATATTVIERRSEGMTGVRFDNSFTIVATRTKTAGASTVIVTVSVEALQYQSAGY